MCREALSEIIGPFSYACKWFTSRTSAKLYEKDFFGTVIEIIGYRYKPKLLVTLEKLMKNDYGPESSVIYVSISVKSIKSMFQAQHRCVPCAFSLLGLCIDDEDELKKVLSLEVEQSPDVIKPKHVMVQKYDEAEVLIMMFCENTYTNGTVNHHIFNANTMYQRRYSLPKSFKIGGKTMIYKNKHWEPD